MIGQHNLQSRIEYLIVNNEFPRFSIFVGPKGSGKKTLVNWIYQRFGSGILSNIGTSVDSVRLSIAQSYTIRGSQVIYLFADADNMSPAAKNALLKVTEEPPNDCYFIMTLEDENNTLETIRSRGTIFHMERYTPDEIFEYYWSLEGSDLMTHGIPNDAELVRELCETPGDVQTLVKMGVQEFYDYVRLVADNIAQVSLANAFKIPSKVALKDGAEGYDLRLFWKAFMKLCIEEHRPDVVTITSLQLQKLRIKGINREMLMDSWIVEVRDVWS